MEERFPGICSRAQEARQSQDQENDRKVVSPANQEPNPQAKTSAVADSRSDVSPLQQLVTLYDSTRQRSGLDRKPFAIIMGIVACVVMVSIYTNSFALIWSQLRHPVNSYQQSAPSSIPQPASNQQQSPTPENHPSNTSSIQVNLSPVFNLIGIYSDNATFPSSDGIDGVGYALPGTLLGTSLNWNSQTFNIGAAGVNDVVTCTGQKITFATEEQGKYSTLMLLGLAINGSQASQTFKVTYTDNSSTSFTQGISDWYAPQHYDGEDSAWTCNYRVVCNGSKDDRTFNIYGYTFELINTRTIQSISVPNNSQVKLLAITLFNNQQPSAQSGQRWPWTSERLVAQDDLKSLSSNDRELMRNEIYARHGWIFKRQDLQQHFSSQSWYKPAGAPENREVVDNRVATLLNSVEKQNAQKILDYEKSIGGK